VRERTSPVDLSDRWCARLLGWLAALLCLLLPPGAPTLAAPPPAEARAAAQLERARETRAFTEQHYQYLAGGPDCPRAVFVSYRHSERAPDISDQWYDVSQIWADLALAPPDEPLARCWAIRGFTFLDRLWDRATPIGGFFPRSDLDGEQVVKVDKYADDNSLAGLAWLEAASLSPDPLERELMLARARATADFLMEGDLWDDTFGGGFWWNTHRGDMLEGKPAQTNGLAAEFFLQLYGMTDEPAYRAWAENLLDWLDRRLYEPAARLYRWSIHFDDRQQHRGEQVSDRFFSYDQSILIEAHLLAYRLLGGEERHLERARSLGRRLDPVFWDDGHGGYNLEAGIPQVFTVYSAWLTPGLLLLYEQDGDPYWLDRASANVDALNRTVRDPASGGYAQRHYLCRDPNAPGCGGGAPWAIGPERQVVDQAWMQRAQALLATALLRSAPEPRKPGL
jgi:hypothetical protein